MPSGTSLLRTTVAGGAVLLWAVAAAAPGIPAQEVPKSHDSRIGTECRRCRIAYQKALDHTLARLPQARFPAKMIMGWLLLADGQHPKELAQGIGFSRDRTLKATVRRLVKTSDAGRTQQELQRLLGVRVHNPLLQLAESRKIGRESIQGEYVYVAEGRRAKLQLARRRTLVAEGLPTAMVPPGPTLEVEVLVEIIHSTVVRLDAEEVAARLVARGVAATTAQVEAVFRRHGVEKKNGAVSLSVLAGLRQQVAALHAVGQRQVRSTGGLRVFVDDHPKPCPVCRGFMGVQKTIHRHGTTLEHGPFQVRETV